LQNILSNCDQTIILFSNINKSIVSSQSNVCSADRTFNLEHALPDAAEVTKVEDVMKLGWCWQHLDLRHLPDDSSCRDQVIHKLHNRLRKPRWAEIATANHSEDLVDRVVRRKSTVEDGELALETLWNIVPASSRMDHCRKELDIDNVGKLSRLLETVETLGLHRLAGDFVGDLVSPFVDNRHVDVVNKHGHSLSTRRTVSCSDTLFHVALDNALEQHWSGG